MTSWSDNIDCPKCEDKQSFYISQDSRDVLCNLGFCLNCGYSYRTVEEQLSLDEVNSERGEWKLPPLEKLPETRFSKRIEKEKEKKRTKLIDLSKEYPIFFSDLLPTTQESLLLYFGLKSPREMNWDEDTIPVTVLPKPEGTLDKLRESQLRGQEKKKRKD